MDGNQRRCLTDFLKRLAEGDASRPVCSDLEVVQVNGSWAMLSLYIHQLWEAITESESDLLHSLTSQFARTHTELTEDTFSAYLRSGIKADELARILQQVLGRQPTVPTRHWCACLWRLLLRGPMN